MKDNIVVFDTVGSHTWTTPSGISEVEVLVVAGGGAGGGSLGGGGGAGGLIHDTKKSVSGDISITVGAGGSANSLTGDKGDDSVFGSLTAEGGGAGFSGDDGTSPPARCNGGSGGGGSRYGGNSDSDNPGGTGTYPQGVNGGFGCHSGDTEDQEAGAGGGGYKEAGRDGNRGAGAGPGGNGYETDILGTSYYFAGGGGGGMHNNGSSGAGNGGLGGGGGGGATSDPVGAGGQGYNDGQDGTTAGGNGGANTGGGGGGGGWNSASGGDGGSGIVVVAWNDVTPPMRVYKNGEWKRVENLALGSNIDADTVDGLHASEIGGDDVLLAEGTGTNINASNTVSWNNTTISDPAFSFDGSTVTFQEAGTFEMRADADFNSTNSRVSPSLSFFYNGSRKGPMGRSGYMRNAEGHNTSSVHASLVVEVTAGDTVHVEGYQNSSKSENVSPNRSHLYIKKLHR